MNVRLTEKEKILIRRALKARKRRLESSGQTSRCKEVERLIQKVERSEDLCLN